MKLIKTSLLLSVLCSTSLVLANHHMTPEKMLEKCDTNNDGSISESEFIEQKREKFKKMDKDGNGSLDKNEIQMMMDKMKEKMSKKMDHPEMDHEDE